MRRNSDLQTGFMCHPCNGMILGIGMYLALVLPIAQKAPLPTLTVWLLFGTGLLMYAAAGIVVWEVNFLLVILGWAIGLGASWLLSDFDIAKDVQFYGTFAATLLPAAVADGIFLHRVLTTRERG